MRRILFILFLFSLSPGFSQVDNALLLSRLNMKNGLSSNGVHCIFQDSRGFVWIGTDHGLNRFDGKNIKVFSHDIHDSASIPDNLINNMVEDKQGNIWFGHPRGISSINTRNYHIRNFNLTTVFPGDNWVEGNKNVYIDRQERLWVYGGALSYYDTKTKTFIRLPHLPDSHNTVKGRIMTSLLLDAQNTLWVTTGEGLFSFDFQTNKYTWHPCHSDELFFQKFGYLTQALVELNDSCLMFTSYDQGLMILNKRTNKAFCYKPSYGNTFLIDIRWMEKTEKWLNTPEGIWRYDQNMKLTGVWRNHGDSLPLVPHADNLIQTKEGVIFLGSREEGVFILNPHAQVFHSFIFPKKESIYTPFREAGDIHSIGFTANKIIAGGWYQGALFAFDENLNLVKTIINYGKRTPSELCSMTSDMLTAEDGKLWLATFYGLVELNTNTWKYNIYTPEKNDSLFFRKKRFLLLKEDKAGRIWLANYRQNLCYFDKQEKKFTWLEPHQNQVTDIYNLCIDKAGRVWFTNNDELISYDIQTNAFKYYRNPGVYMNNGSVIAGDNALWISSDIGLWRFDLEQHQFTNWNMVNGLCNDNVGSLLFDKKGRLWMGTDNGLAAFDTLKKIFYNFHTDDGLLSEKLTNAISMRDNGNIYLGYHNSFSWFNPDEAIRAIDKYPSYITSCIVNGKDYEFAGDSIKKLELVYNENNFNFHFSVINLDQPAQTIYYYKLEGFDKIWKSSQDGQINYTNLDDGKYILRVSSDPNRKDDSKDDFLMIVIRPPFWKTWWFILGGILFVVFTTMFFVRRRIHLIRKEADRKAAISQQIADLRMRALRTQMTPHFLFNSLNAIQECCVTGQLDAATQYLAKFSKLVRLILENSDKQWISLDDEIQVLKLYLDVESLRFTHSFEYHFENSVNEDSALVKIPPMIVQPFVENAIWHGLLKKDGNRKLDIRFYIEEEKLVIEVEDNGVGRREKKNEDGHKSMGMGIIEERVKLLEIMTGARAEIKITDKKDSMNNSQGTLVTLKIQLI